MYTEAVHQLKNVAFWDVTLCGSCKNVLKERITSIIREERMSELGTTLAISS
jgi:hypothetical protein